MIRPLRIIVFILLVPLLFTGRSFSFDSGLLRTIPVTTPQRGRRWISNTSFYAPITVNNVLKRTYGVSDSRIFSALTHASLGITNHVALVGTIPFYADMFTQGSRDGEKTGPGDISLGLRVSLQPEKSVLRGISLGANARIPEEFGYGKEPLGFRTFSTSEFAYSAELSLGITVKSVEGYLSAALHQFHNAPAGKTAYPGDVFYESSYGYLGIGKADAAGRADVIFQDHVTVTTGAAVPLKSWISGIVEVSTTSFTGNPSRSTILRAAPGLRLGRPENIHVSVGLDFRIHGPIPERTYIVQVTVPFLRPRAAKIPAGKEPTMRELVRSRNSLVAVKEFKRSDIAYLYEDELRHKFQKELGSMDIMRIVPVETVNRAYQRLELVPLEDSSEHLGIRLGANYLILADVINYSVERGSSFKIPYLIGFPKTTFSLSAKTKVTDLVTGETRDLGNISAEVIRPRGVNMFPAGASSDIIYISEPERRMREKELIDRWVDRFNDIIFQNMEVFGWEPKRIEIRGDEETRG